MRAPMLAVLGAAIACLPLAVPVPASGATGGPDEWDQRLEPYVRFVERTRRLDFDRPVKVRFEDERAFRRAASEWYDDVSEEVRELAEIEGNDLLALGLVTRPVDLLAAQEAADVEGLLGFYDEETGELTVRGDDLDDVEVQVTLVHELVHALQDQHFDLAGLQRRTGSDGASIALSALIEGDATRVERDYLWSLPERVQDEYWDDTTTNTRGEAATDAGDAARTESIDGVADPSWPLVLELWSALDYDLAPSALDVVVATRGTRAVDSLFRSPPRSEEQIIDPVALATGDGPRKARLPRFAEGETPRAEASDWGAFSWYLLLSSRIPWTDALTAVEGWGGDRYRSYERVVDGVTSQCVRLVVTGDTRRDTSELETAITAWAEALPPGAVQVARDGELVVASACPTADAPASGDDAMEAAYERLWERTDQMRYLVDRGKPASTELRCVATSLVADVDVGPLLYVDRDLTRAEERVLDQALDEAFGDCG